MAGAPDYTKLINANQIVDEAVTRPKIAAQAVDDTKLDPASRTRALWINRLTAMGGAEGKSWPWNAGADYWTPQGEGVAGVAANVEFTVPFACTIELIAVNVTANTFDAGNLYIKIHRNGADEVTMQVQIAAGQTGRKTSPTANTLAVAEGDRLYLTIAIAGAAAGSVTVKAVALRYRVT